MKLADSMTRVPLSSLIKMCQGIRQVLTYGNNSFLSLSDISLTKKSRWQWLDIFQYRSKTFGLDLTPWLVSPSENFPNKRPAEMVLIFQEKLASIIIK
jgi:hypothetical protein